MAKSEILYIQAGSFANHIGTHFWNTQESYFTYEDGDDPVVFHDTSFRQGLTANGEPTYCPRVLVFDRKSHFGALSNDLYGDDEISENANQWQGGFVEYHQDAIPRSQYQNLLDEGDAEDDDQVQSLTSPSDFRFWSDYCRVYFHPRSLQRLPDPAEWQAIDGDWNTSRETFQSYESEHQLLDNDLRLFVEECDGLQGIQILNDCTSFGGFADAFLTAFRDDFPKLPSLAFPLLSSASNSAVSAAEPHAMKALNDALCLRGLDNMSMMNVPIQDPSTWQDGEWRDSLNLDMKSPYHTSALLSAHIESVTLPLRLKASMHDLSSMTSMLNPSGITRTAHLGGIYPYPVPATAHMKKRIYDLSAVSEAVNGKTAYARMHVLRGLGLPEIKQYDELLAANMTPRPFSIHALAYPTPSSFPPLAPKYEHARNRVLSTLTTSSATSSLFAAYARLAQECVDRRAEVVTRMGLEFDDVRELKDELWAFCDGYAGDEGDGEREGEEELGEDED